MQKIVRYVLLLGILGGGQKLFGQDVGDRLRVTIDEGALIGTVTAMGPGSLDLDLEKDGLRTVAFRDIRKMERSVDVRTYKGRGFLVGFVPGFVIGGLLGAEAAEVSCLIGTLGLASCDRTEDKLGPAIVMGTIVGAGVGLGGMAIGGAIKRDVWTTVPAPSMSGFLRLVPLIGVSLGRERNPTVVVGLRATF